MTAGITILLILIPLIIAAIIIFRSFSKGALSRSPLVLKDQIQGDSTGLGVEDMQKLVGREGVSLTPLRPSGNGDFDGEKLDVVSDGAFIPQGARIRIVRVEGLRILVKAC